jgi:hypothetical protein
MKKIIVTFSLLLFIKGFSQNYNFKKEQYVWPNTQPDISKMNNNFSSDDLVIIDESISFNLMSGYAQDLSKNCIIRINNERGLKKISKILLPESFDETADKHLYQQGRQSKEHTPYIHQFEIKHFAARILKTNGNVVNVEMNVTTQKALWVNFEGKRLPDFNYWFTIPGLEIGDILEYNYTIEFLGRYGSNLFYFNSSIPKQNLTFKLSYYPVPKFENFDIICNNNISDSCFTKSSKKIELPPIHKQLFTYSYNYKNLSALNFATNACAGKTMPHILVDFDFMNFVTASASIPDETVVNFNRGPQFEWPKLKKQFIEERIYDKQHASIRSFLEKAPYNENEPAAFLTALTDTINNLRFESTESLSNSDNMQYSLPSGAWLMKGKLIEEFMYQLYWQMLGEKNFQKNIVSIQDKRLGEIKFNYRTEPDYEKFLFGISNGKSISLLMPRINGLKYHFNEIPFYYEGANAALLNFKDFDLNGLSTLGYFYKALELVNFIKTPSSTENENVRTEAAVFKISVDSSIIHASIKEGLSGQFSTIVRPAYLKESIDSTVNPIYFKKCSEKPNATTIKIKTIANANTFPFKNSFAITENISITTPSDISLKDWFSFTLNNTLINEKPNFDYYFDFRYTDVYNYMLDFSKPTDILNLSDFTKSIQNNYFEISSTLTKQSDTIYLLSVMAKIKQSILPKEEGQLLVEFANNLEQLNKLSLKLK